MTGRVIYQTYNSEQCKELEEEVNEVFKNYAVTTTNNNILAQKDGKNVVFSPYKNGVISDVSKRDGSEGGKLESMTKDELILELNGKKYVFDLKEGEE